MKYLTNQSLNCKIKVELNQPFQNKHSIASCSTSIGDYEMQPVMPLLEAGLVEGIGGLVSLSVLAIVGYAAFRPAFLIPDPNEALIVRGARGTKVVHDRGIFLFGALNKLMNF